MNQQRDLTLDLHGSFHVYDTTLRDGMQQEGLNPTVADKLAIARHLDELGVGYIEGGWPGANPKDTEFFRRAAQAGEIDLGAVSLSAAETVQLLLRSVRGLKGPGITVEEYRRGLDALVRVFVAGLRPRSPARPRPRLRAV